MMKIYTAMRGATLRLIKQARASCAHIQSTHCWVSAAMKRNADDFATRGFDGEDAIG
jgi:hypothetical protein